MGVDYSAGSRARGQAEVQGNKLDTLAYHSAKLGGCKMWQIKVQAIVTKSDWDT